MIEFHQILPIYNPMYNKDKIKKKNIGYHVNLFCGVITHTQQYLKVYSVHR